MALIRFDASGSVVQYFQNDDILARMGGTIPSNVVSNISFDETTNAALIQDITDNIPLYTNSAGVLKKSGVTVTINTPSQNFLDSNQLATLKAILDPTAGAITIAQAKVMFRVIFRSLNKAGLL